MAKQTKKIKILIRLIYVLFFILVILGLLKLFNVI